MRPGWTIAILGLAIGLAAPRAGAAPLAMHADGSVSGFNATTNPGYGFGAGIGTDLLSSLSAGLEFSWQKYSTGEGIHIPEISYIGGGNDYLASALITARARIEDRRGQRVFLESGVGGARLSHSATYWNSMNPPFRFTTPSSSRDVLAIMVGAGYQTEPILGPLRLELTGWHEWAPGDIDRLAETRVSLGVAL